MPTFTRILGTLAEEPIAERVHALSHSGALEVLTVDKTDLLRRRLRLRTDKGTEVVVALDRSEQLTDGAVLSLDPERAILVRTNAERWLSIVPRSADAALEAGYFVGNLHWRVKFVPGAMMIALEGPLETYLERLAGLMQSDKVEVSQP